MDALTRWVEDNEAEIMEQALISAFTEGVQLRLGEWFFRVRDHGDHFNAFEESTFFGVKYDATFSTWLFEKARTLKVEVTHNPILGIVVRSRWNETVAAVTLTREEIDLSAEDANAYKLLCEVTALRLLAVWAEDTNETTIQHIVATRRQERSRDLQLMHAAMIREAREQREVLEGLRGGQPTALTKHTA